MSIYSLLAVAVVMGGLGAYFSEKKGRTHLEGFLMGFLLGLIGLLIVLALPKKKKEDQVNFSFSSKWKSHKPK